MQRDVAGHQLGAIRYEIDGFAICSAVRISDGADLLAKAPRHDFPSLAEVQRLEHELVILQPYGAGLLGVLRPLYRIDDNQNSYVVYDAFNGVPVDVAGINAIDLPVFYRFARALMRALGECHREGLVHRSLTPRSILWDQALGAVRLTHFVAATSRKSLGHEGMAAPLSAFSAPEQTGQLNIGVDDRSDLYAAGAVFYYLLSDSHLFPQGSQQAELAHSLVAKEPTPLGALKPEMDRALVALVSRLTAKNPGDRFQTAAEVDRELERLESDPIAAKTAESQSPPLAAATMRGREVEFRALAGATAEAASGLMRTVFLEGSAGSGKSRLVEALRESLSAGRSLFAIGKFDQYRRHRPYSALLDAVEALLERFLSGPDADLNYWRERFEAIDPPLRAVLAQQVPHLNFIIGKQTAPPPLGPAETQNRFHQAFRALLDALCDSAHPLVLVIDDLQWSDDETTAMLSELFLPSKRSFLTLVLAFRRREISLSPAARLVAESSGVATDAIRHIALGSLGEVEIADLCAEAVDPCHDRAALTTVVQRRCHGNPLFALEIIRRLRRTGCLNWLSDADGGGWHLRADTDAHEPESDNVVDLMVGRIDALPDTCRRAVVAASCIGHAFRISELVVATALSETELGRALRVACDEGLVVPELAAAQAWLADEEQGDSPPLPSLTFRFSHDRLQQAAHSLSTDDERRHLHLIVGRKFREGADHIRESLFATLEHLNAVSDLLDSAERLDLAELNFRGGRAAKDSIAYKTATAAFEKAIQLTSATPSDRIREFKFRCLVHLGESLYLASEFERSEATFELALKQASTKVEEVEVHRTRLILYQHMQRYEEAITLGLRALRLLRVNLPERPSPVRLLASLTALMTRARKTTVDVLSRMPDRAEARDRAVLDLLILLWTPTFWVNQRLNALIVVKLMAMTLRLGNTPQAPMAYVCFGILNHVLFKAYERGLDFGKLAMNMVGAGSDPFVASRVRFLALTFFGPLQRGNRSNVDIYQEALARCLSDGEHVFAGHTIDGMTTSLPIQGFRVPDIERRLDAYAASASQISSGASMELISVVRDWCRRLSRPRDSSTGQIRAASLRFDSCVGIHTMLGMATAYLWDEDAEVLRLAHQLRKNVVIQSSPLHASFHALFTALSLCRSRPRGALGRLRPLRKRIGRFHSIFPANFGSMLHLVDAEMAILLADRETVVRAYHRAIGEASGQGHDLVHAISCERLAAYYDAQGDGKRCQEYLAVAVYSYGRFGAASKADDLVRKHPGIDLTPPGSGTHPGEQTVDLGVEAVMRAAYAIAEETRSDRLARNLLRVITTTAGGQRGFLVRQDASRWVVLAGWESDAEPRDYDIQTLDHSVTFFSTSVVRYVGRTKQVAHLHDPARDPRFKGDPYLQDRQPRSLLCLPLMHRGELSAILYLENSICAEVFTDEQRRLATLLGHQAAISMAVADYHKVEMDALQAKINPHFLYNTLSVVAELVVADPQAAEAAVLKLSKLYRYVLNSSSDQIVTLEQELAITRDYLTLEQYRFGGRLGVEFRVVGPVERVHVPALIFQPLVENGVRHGVAKKVGPGVVRVEVTVEGDFCRMRVEDDGPGWQEPSSEGGFGLRSVRRRLSLLYEREFELNIRKTGGVCVEIKIPIDRTRKRPAQDGTE